MSTRRINPADYITISHAAELAGVSIYWMRLSVQRGTMPGVQIDGVWFVFRAAAEGFQRHPTAGRPRNAAKKA